MKLGKPIIDLNMAYRASYVISRSVLGPENCPALEIQLRNVLLEHENYLRNAEIESSNKIIRLLSERDELVTKKVPSNSIVAKIKNWFIRIRAGLKDRTAISNKNNYSCRRHLENVANHYKTEANRTAANYGGWYDYQIPQINFNIVHMELLEIQTVSKILGIDQNRIRALSRDENISIYLVGNSEIVRRTYLDRLARISVH